jgi:hypothetical protein
MTFISFAALVLVGVGVVVLALYVLMRRWL